VYAKRYRDDAKFTCESGTFTVKDESGRVVHFSHHFTHAEIINLLRDFSIIDFREEVFTSYYHGNWAKGYTVLAQKSG